MEQTLLAVPKMPHKRPFVDEDSCEVASKHPRQLEYGSQIAPTTDIFPANDTEKPQNSDGEGEDSFTRSQDEGRLINDPVTRVSNETKLLEAGVTGRFSQFLLVNGGIIGADIRSEAATNLSFFPEFFHSGQPKAVYQSDDFYSAASGFPPQKLVSVGPEHQAFVPDWNHQHLKISSDHQDKSDSQLDLLHASDGGLLIDDVDKRLMGTCLIPMPKLEASAKSCHSNIRSDCSCPDMGSIRCVRQHATEARENLRENLGKEIFEELGFCEMGEEVAKRWTEEEENIFHQVVLSNPASLGKNFWDHLLAVFPFRTKKDLVSYYFNVFMLQKRAEQNRFAPLNIDSDNDEWQTSEFVLAEEDEDSVVESPFDQEATLYCQEDHAKDCPEHLKGEEEMGTSEHGTEIRIHSVGTDEEDGGDIDDISTTHVINSPSDCHGDVDTDLCSKILTSSGVDYDNQDDSCTSYEFQPGRVDSCG